MTDILLLVESLHTELTNPNVSIQQTAFNKLNDGIRNLKLSNFSSKEVKHIIYFYVEHMVVADPGLIAAIIDGLQCFADAFIISATDAKKICSDGFFSKLQIQSLGKQERQKAIKLLYSLIRNKDTLAGLLEMKIEFIHGFIASVELEKDPQCLMLIFEMHCIVMQNFKLGHLEEEYFDVVAAYFPVDYALPPDNPTGINRTHLVSKLHSCLFKFRNFAGSLLLPLLIEKAASHWVEGRSDALNLIADCLTGIENSPLSYNCSEFYFSPPSNATVQQPIPIVHITAYMFGLCNLIRELTLQLDPIEDKEDIQRVLTIVHGLINCYKLQQSENVAEDFIVTFISTLWPDRKEKITFENWFTVPPPNTHSALPKSAPQGVLADCLLAAVCSSICQFQQNDSETISIFSSLMCSNLFQRLVLPLITPKIDTLPEDNIFYEAKFDQLITWTPQLGFFNHLMDNVERLNKRQDIRSILANFADEKTVNNIIFNLSNFLKVVCIKLSLCTNDNLSPQTSSKSDKLQRRLTEMTLFNLLCRLLMQTKNTSLLENIQTHFLDVYQHILNHVAQPEEDALSLLQSEQLLILSRLVISSNPIVTDILDLLFKILKDNNPNSLLTVSTEVLQRAACESESILNSLLTVLCEISSSKNKLSKIETLCSVLLFLAEYSPKCENRLTKIAHFCIDQLPLFMLLNDHCTTMADVETIESVGSTILSISNLANALRAVVCELPDSKQQTILEAFNHSSTTSKPCNNTVLVILRSAIISSLRPKLANQLLESLFDELLLATNCVLTKLSTVSENRFYLELAGKELARAFTSLLNKSPNIASIEKTNMFMELCGHHVSASTECGENVIQLLASFMILSLRALLSRSLIEHIEDSKGVQQLLNVICPGVSLEYITNDSWPIALQINCLTSQIGLLLSNSEDVSLSNLSLEQLHGYVNPFYAQQCFCIIALRIQNAWKNTCIDACEIKNPSSLCNTQLKDAYLFAFLKMSSMLPEPIIQDYIDEILNAAILAITTGVYSLKTQTLALSLLSIIGVQLPAVFITNLSEISADDLFRNLPFLLSFTEYVQQTPNQSKNDAEVVSLRFNLARCLACLVDLPDSITTRYRKNACTILEKLVDDNCRLVRLEGVKAINRWFSKA